MLGACALGSAQAAVVASRVDLQTLLGGPGTVAHIEASARSAGTANNVPCDTGILLMAATMCTGIGSGPVPVGLAIRNPIDNCFQFDAAGCYGAPSDEVLITGTAIVQDFDSALRAIGLDLRASAGYPCFLNSPMFSRDSSRFARTNG
jgi:hypothetical protein